MLLLGCASLHDLLSFPTRRSADLVSDELIRPALRVAGFTDGLLADPKRVKLLNAGESAPAKRVKKGAKCQSLPEDRRVIVIVQ